MLVVCAGKALKQPVEIEIPDDEYEKIQKLGTPALQNDAIASYAVKHVKKYGYDLGSCSDRKRNVDFNTCIACGIKRGLNKTQWELCKSGNITYKYPTSKTTVKAIKTVKDDSIRSKLELSPEELEQAKNLYMDTK